MKRGGTGGGAGGGVKTKSAILVGAPKSKGTACYNGQPYLSMTDYAVCKVRGGCV